MTKVTQLKRNLASGTVTTAANAALGLVSYPVYLHFLGYEGYGLWAILGTVISFAQLGNLGVSQAITTFAAAEQGRGNTKGVEAYASSATTLLAAIGLVLAAVTFVVREYLASLFKITGAARAQFVDLAPLAALLSGYVLVVQVYGGLLTGLGRMDRANGLSVMSRILGFGTSMLALTAGWGVAGLLVGNAVSQVASHYGMWIYVRRQMRIDTFRLRAVTREAVTNLVRFGATLSAGQMASMLFQPFNKVIVSRYAGLSSVSVLDLAFSGSSQIRALLQAGFGALTPEISKLEGGSPAAIAARVRHLNERSMAAIFALAAPAMVAIAFMAPELLHTWLRSRYVWQLVPIFRLALAASFISLLGVPAYYLLLGLGRVRVVAASHFVQAMGNACAVALAAGVAAQLTLVHIGVGLMTGAALATALLIYTEHSYVRWLNQAASTNAIEQTEKGLDGCQKPAR